MKILIIRELSLHGNNASYPAIYCPIHVNVAMDICVELVSRGKVEGGNLHRIYINMLLHRKIVCCPLNFDVPHNVPALTLNCTYL